MSEKAGDVVFIKDVVMEEDIRFSIHSGDPEDYCDWCSQYLRKLMAICWQHGGFTICVECLQLVREGKLSVFEIVYEQQ